MMSKLSQFNKIKGFKSHRFESFAHFTNTTGSTTITPPPGCYCQVVSTVQDSRNQYTIITSAGKVLLSNGNIWRYGEAAGPDPHWAPRNFAYWTAGTDESITFTLIGTYYEAVKLTAYFYRYY